VSAVNPAYALSLAHCLSFARAAAIQLGKMMATEFAKRGLGVRVNTINPGYFPTVSYLAVPERYITLIHASRE
jgi:NAD(P)-dependent dehydrogenase (short-subunit alcohol dehydrogenase family)